MSRLTRLSWTGVIWGAGIISAGAALADGRPAEAILKDLETVELPKRDVSKGKEQEYLTKWMAARKQAMAKRSALILELYKTAPTHELIPKLMVERWQSIRSPAQVDDVVKEIDDVLAHTSDTKFKVEAAYAKAHLKLFKGRSDGTPDLSGVEEFIKLAPKDPRGAGLLFSPTLTMKKSTAKAALEDRILKDFPDSWFAGMIEGSRRQRKAVSTPFDLAFTDAIKGTNISIKGLKGKVVVIDFWAVWCGPCVAEMPKMKALYAKYRDRGVEFIGVSLDLPKEQRGLEKLKQFVAEKGIAWPQYYQGNGWESEFSTSWGINSIPCVFVIDQAGKLYSVDAGGKLDEMIPALLENRTEVKPN